MLQRLQVLVAGLPIARVDAMLAGTSANMALPPLLRSLLEQRRDASAASLAASPSRRGTYCDSA